MFNISNTGRKYTNDRDRTMDDREWSRWKLCAEYQSDNSIQWNSRRYLCLAMDDLQWRLYSELRSGNNQTGCKSITSSGCRNPSNLMCYFYDFSSQCTDDRYRNLDDHQWGRRKLCECQQSHYSIQWCIGHHL